MKKCSFFTFPVIAIAASLLFISCKKEGPAGPQGEQGEKGDPGANVIYSAWINVDYEPNTQQNGPVLDTIGWLAQIDAPKLTADILNQGAIKVYLNLNTSADPIVVSIPFLNDIDPIFSTSVIYLGALNDWSTIDFGSGNIIQQYRYILIPGEENARNSINWNDYESVKKYLHLKN